MARNLFIHATNVHQGGGRSLLTALLSQSLAGIKLTLSLDCRMPVPDVLERQVIIKRVKPSVVQRLMAEKWLSTAVSPEDVVVCFGNLPPLFKVHGHVVVFLQNRYLVDDVGLRGFSFRVRVRLTIERLWLLFRMSQVDQFVVQTRSMQVLLEARTKGKIPIRILPFIADRTINQKLSFHSSVTHIKDFDFLYVASGEPHKNHRKLVEAWCVLAAEGLFPSLRLTVDPVQYRELCFWMQQKIGRLGLNITNAGNLPHEHVRTLYSNAGALIYPSTFESFGIPLIEAGQVGLAVLAPELDYVRDILNPAQTFDPVSAVSISRAVKRFMGVKQQPLPLQNAAEFIRSIIEGAN